MSTFQFDGVTYDEGRLGAALDQAAEGVPQTQRRDMIHDPASWAGQLLEAALRSPLAKAAGRHLGRLLRSDSPDAVSLAVRLQFETHAASAEDTLAAMRRLRTAGQSDEVFQLAAALDQIIDRGGFRYTPELRDFADDFPTRRVLMRQYLRHDRPWVAAQAARLFPPEPRKAVGLIAAGTSGFSRAELQAVARDLDQALAALPEETARAVRDCLASLIARASGTQA